MSEAVHLDLPADARFFRLVAACVAELIAIAPGVTDAHAVSHDLQLAVQELCANVADHAYAGTVDGRLQIALAIVDGRAVVDLRDAGQPFDEACVRTTASGEVSDRGYGLALIRALVDEVTYRRQDGRNHWRLVKQLA
jgi:serine/threonine-protein kinase RsbW